MQDKMEESRYQKYSEEDIARMSMRDRELKEFRDLIGRREQEFEAQRAKFMEEQLQRERQFQREFEERERLFTDREKKVVDRQRDFERNFSKREAELEALRDHLQFEISSREARLQQALVEFEQEKSRYKEENLKRVEATSRSYVSEALDLLEKKEGQFHFISKLWGGIGAIGLIGGLAFFVYISLTSAMTVSADITWPFLAFSVFKGLISVALVAGLAKYAFLFSSYYMQESLKNADRRHAINFGKFYLESYGAAAEWSQVKEAFEHWNISESNAFTRADTSLPDISVLEKSVAFVERIGRALPKAPVNGSGA
ncbi:TPA: hypothetical protein UL768_000709 [Stenotrophomonas maltophilia]|nr:hypothetical protein [Stenotrophomonas maltophilia]